MSVPRTPNNLPNKSVLKAREYSGQTTCLVYNQPSFNFQYPILSPKAHRNYHRVQSQNKLWVLLGIPHTSKRIYYFWKIAKICMKLQNYAIRNIHDYPVYSFIIMVSILVTQSWQICIEIV